MTISFSTNKLIEGGDMSSSFQSDEIILHGKEGFSIHAIFVGIPDGALYLAVSNDNFNWSLLADSTVAITEAGDVFYNVTESKYAYVRLHYSANSGSGTLDAFFKAKGEL